MLNYKKIANLSMPAALLVSPVLGFSMLIYIRFKQKKWASVLAMCLGCLVFLSLTVALLSIQFNVQYFIVLNFFGAFMVTFLAMPHQSEEIEQATYHWTTSRLIVGGVFLLFFTGLIGLTLTIFFGG